MRGEFRTQQEEETACAHAGDTGQETGRKRGKEKERKEEKVRGKENVGRNMAQVPYWWNRDRSSCRHLWYPITGLRRNAPRIVHLLASVLENGASRFASKYPLLRVSLSLSLILSSKKKKSRFLPDSSEHGTIIRYLTDHSRFSLGWSTPVKVTGGSKPRLISSQCPRRVRRPITTIISSFRLPSLARDFSAQFFIIDRSIEYPLPRI